MPTAMSRPRWALILAFWSLASSQIGAFHSPGVTRWSRACFSSETPSRSGSLGMSSDKDDINEKPKPEWTGSTENPNAWVSAEDTYEKIKDTWEEEVKAKQDGSFWSSFESTESTEERDQASEDEASDKDEDSSGAVADSWLETLASLSAQETQFNMQEAERADKARQMQEWGFDAETISNALGVATDSKNEIEAEMENFRKAAYVEEEEEIDWTTVESHTMVERDPDNPSDPIRQQMVYVDEHTCIGCTNCAMVASSTFFMEDELGRARVFQQWGDDDETIQIAIETCPVDCIHYVPYDELVKLEVDRRNQHINFKARLVSQSEYGGSAAVVSGSSGALPFTGPQKISGNAGTRCNNCPSRGCRDCPMYGVGKNPEFERKEKARLERRERLRLERQREEEQKSAEL